MKPYTVVSLAVALPLGAYLLIGPSSLPEVRAQGQADRGTITLQMQGGSCQAAVTSRIKSKRGRVVQWSITNNCGAEQALQLTDFRLGGQSRDPLGCGAADRGKRVGAGGHAVLTCPVKNDADLGVYSYMVAVSGAGMDPEIEIEN